MNTKTIRYLAVAVIVLVAILVTTELTDNGDSSSTGRLLFPELKARINDISTLAISDDDEASTTIQRTGDGWTVAERDGYPADVGKIRQVLLAIADARTLEQKTANPDRYTDLGVADPGADGAGRLLRITGDDFTYEVIIGNRAQTKYRYARIAGEAQSWLVDADPELPDDAGGWLLTDIVDIDAARVRAVSIVHGDGETISISKESEEDTDFVVSDVPDGRELSYATVANGIGGAMNDLRLTDVARGEAAAPAATTTFETFDGTMVTVTTEKTDDGSWITLFAAGTDAESMNERLAGWRFRVADYKANLFSRRWEDILEAEPEPESE